jgi:uncharacterized protein (TIGR03435 family)
MKRNSEMRLALLSMLISLPAFSQQTKFELADVHVSTTALGFGQNFGGVLRDGRYINRDATMLNLIEAAYGVAEDNIAGGPGWVNSDLFDVIAKVPEGTTAAQAKLMLQVLLADRFGLVIRNESRPVPRYVLTVAKGGSKLRSANGSGNPGCQPKQQQGGRGGGGTPGDLASIPNAQIACHNMTAAQIAENVHQMAGAYLDHDVVDETKLEGSWDFDLEWTAKAALEAKGAEGISVFTAVEKQLGLHLESKTISLPGLVIASVKRKPTENPPGASAALALAAARFEAASIKPQNPSERMTGLLYTGGSQMKAGGTLREMIAMSLQITPNLAADMVIGLPKSAESERWDILAKVPSTGEGAPNIVNGRPLPPPLSIGLEMLRGLLVDQFELKTHSENREVTVYALMLGSTKPKLNKADESERSGCKPDPNAPKTVKNMGPMVSCKNLTMENWRQICSEWLLRIWTIQLWTLPELKGGGIFSSDGQAKATCRSNRRRTQTNPQE